MCPKRETYQARKAVIATKAEQLVAKALAKEGVAFEQSALVAEFEVDFVVGRHIAVEVDGAVHLEAQARERDRYKDQKLASLGFSVLRITNQQASDRAYLQGFAREVRQLWEKEKSVLNPGRGGGPAPLAEHAGLATLKEQLLARERERDAGEPIGNAGGDHANGAAGANSDEELFRQWAMRGPAPDKDGRSRGGSGEGSRRGR